MSPMVIQFQNPVQVTVIIFVIFARNKGKVSYFSILFIMC